MKGKKLSASAITIIVLSVLLVVSVAVAATLAWFAGQDSASGTLVLGQPVNVLVTDINGNDTENLNLTISADTLLPGMRIAPNIAVTLQPSTTASILRAKFDVTVANEPQNGTFADDFRNQITDEISNAWRFNEEDGWYYYLGGSGDGARVMETTAEASTLTAPEFGTTTADYGDVVTGYRNWNETKTETVLASVVSGGANKTITFVSDAFRLPTSLTNEYAGTTISIEFEVEALQDYLVVSDSNVLPTLVNAQTIFNSL